MSRSIFELARTALVVLLVVISTSVQAKPGTPSTPQTSDVCENEVPMSLDGVVGLRKEYGPPGWGEDPAHDSRWTMVVLQLSAESRDRVKSLMRTCVSDPHAFEEIQLWLPDKAGSAKNFDKAKVHVKGSLYPANGPAGEILPLQFDVSSVRKN